MAPQIRRLRQDVEDEVPLHYEGMPLSSGARRLSLAGGGLMVLLGVLGMVRGDGAALEAAGAACGALGVVVLILSWRFRLCEIIAGDRWLIVRCGPIRHRFGRHDAVLGESRPASSWRRLYSEREVALVRFSHGVALVVPIGDLEGLRSVLPESGP